MNDLLGKSLKNSIPGVAFNDAIVGAANNYRKLSKLRYNDKYKHSLMSCEEARKGPIQAATIGALGLAKEVMDLSMNKNTLSESKKDLDADFYGIKQGLYNSWGNCNELVQKKYKKYY